MKEAKVPKKSFWTRRQKQHYPPKNHSKWEQFQETCSRRFFFLRIFWGWKNKNPKIWILWSPKPPWEVGDYDVWKLRQEMPSSRAPSREAAKPTVQAVQAPVPVRLNPLRAVLKVTFWADVNMVKGWKWWMKLVKRSSCCTWSSYYILYKYLQHIQDIIQDITSVATYQWFDSIYLHVGY